MLIFGLIAFSWPGLRWLWFKLGVVLIVGLLLYIDWVKPAPLLIELLNWNWLMPVTLFGENMSPFSVITYSNIYGQSILLLKSFTNIRFNNYLNAIDIFGVSGITKSYSSSCLISFAIDFDSNGHFPNNIWNNTTPNDQMSAFIL